MPHVSSRELLTLNPGSDDDQSREGTPHSKIFKNKYVIKCVCVFLILPTHPPLIVFFLFFCSPRFPSFSLSSTFLEEGLRESKIHFAIVDLSTQTSSTILGHPGSHFEFCRIFSQCVSLTQYVVLSACLSVRSPVRSSSLCEMFQ